MEFLDTNILVYAASRRSDDARKSRVARMLIEGEKPAISLQVLGEFYNVATNPRKLGMTHEEAIVLCREWTRFIVLEPTLSLFGEATTLCHRHHITYYDAAILAAAHELRCPVVYSEDLNDGQDYGGVRVVNPFKEL